MHKRRTEMNKVNYMIPTPIVILIPTDHQEFLTAMKKPLKDIH
jgi:hypothetical protein